ncbi:MAG: hypothetical protein JEY96_19245 [Bacteroidales bacterium]|nr:hypothetical protein [Bacteroidales bacterium]
MNIITWNANMAFRKKHERVFELYDPDIVVVQECENPEKMKNNILPHVIWVGDNPNKGLAIFSKYKINTIKSNPCDSKYFLFCEINEITIIAFWAMNNKDVKKLRYIGQVHEFFNKNLEILKKENVIILGDFNWNSNFDEKSSYPLLGDFSELLKIFLTYDFVSAYHSFTNEQFGKEKIPTLYFRKDENNPFHIDYVFLKEKYLITKMDYGKFSLWKDFSDHIPIYIEIDDNSISEVTLLTKDLNQEYIEKYNKSCEYFCIEINKLFERLFIIKIIQNKINSKYKRVINSEFFYSIFESIYEYLIVSLHRIAKDNSSYSLGNFKNDILKNLPEDKQKYFKEKIKKIDFSKKIDKIYTETKTLRNKRFAHNDKDIFLGDDNIELLNLQQLEEYIDNIENCYKILTFEVELSIEKENEYIKEEVELILNATLSRIKYET